MSHPLTAKLNAIQDQGVSIVPMKVGESGVTRGFSWTCRFERSEVQNHNVFFLSGFGPVGLSFLFYHFISLRIIFTKFQNTKIKGILACMLYT